MQKVSLKSNHNSLWYVSETRASHPRFRCENIGFEVIDIINVAISPFNRSIAAATWIIWLERGFSGAEEL